MNVDMFHRSVNQEMELLALNKKIMKTEIEYYVKNVYGIDIWYVKDDHLREVIKCLTGRETITSYIFEGLKELGFTFKEVLAPKK